MSRNAEMSIIAENTNCVVFIVISMVGTIVYVVGTSTINLHEILSNSYYLLLVPTVYVLHNIVFGTGAPGL